MKCSFSIPQSTLVSLLASMQPICAKRTPLDSTGSILFEIAPHKVTLKATNLNVSLQCSVSIEGSVTEPVSFLISGKRIYKVIAELDGIITFTISDKAVQITTQDGVARSISIKDAHVFPPFPEHIENLIQMESSLVSELLAAVALFIPAKNANSVLDGILLECNAEGLSMVATDSSLHARITSEKYTLPKAYSWLIPKQAVIELKNVLERYTAGTELFLGVCNGYLVFSGTNFNFFARLIAEPYHNYAPHSFRDVMSKYLLCQGADLRSIQLFLGHHQYLVTMWNRHLEYGKKLSRR